MYVGPIGQRRYGFTYDQINFETPADAPDGSVPVQVCIKDLCSDPVHVEFTSKDILLRVEGPAHVHMPLWMDVEIPRNVKFAYPFSICPWDFGGYQLQMRQNGVLLASVAAPPCRATWAQVPYLLPMSSKLPLHLAYPLRAPGTYEVRLVGPLLTPDLTKVARIGHSDWVRFTVSPYSEADRDQWLHDLLTRTGKPGGPNLGQVSISLLASPDEKALATLLDLVLPDPAARGRVGIRDALIGCMSAEVFAAFPSDLVLRFPAVKSLREAGIICR